MSLASLRMYDFSPDLVAANDRLWRAMAARLRDEWVVPAELDRTIAHDAAWLAPDLVFAQTCGYPLVTTLKDEVQLVATPVYGFPGGRGSERCSFLVVRADDPARDLAAMAGRVAAINSRDSNSGMNLFRAAVAPLAGGRAFFARVVETGGHMASLAAVAGGAADIAAIDSVTYGLAARYRPEALAGVRILGETPYGPGLPFITSGRLSGEDLDELRQVLGEVLADPAIADPLGITGLAALSFADYAPLARLEDDARALGYPELG